MNPKEACKNFERAMESIAYTKSKWEAFNDFLDFTLIWMRCWDRKPEHFAALEKKYDYKKYTKHFVDAMFSLLPMSEGFEDPFGDWFMEHLSSDCKGQFFTPMDLCRMMAAALNLKEAEKGSTVLDPTSGSGRTLVAAAELNPDCIFYASDIDLTCVKMTVLNYLLHDMEGEVAWMDVLRMEHWKSWHIRKASDDKGNQFMYYWETGAGETSFVTRLKNTLEQRENSESLPQNQRNSDIPIVMLDEQTGLMLSKSKKHKNQIVLFE
jgi:hypothetical protein